MKKIIIFGSLVLVLLFMAESCIANKNISTNFNTADELKIRRKEIGIYMTFEELTAYADVFIRGCCIGSKNVSDHKEYEFSVLDCFYGEVETKSIILSVDEGSVIITNKEKLYYSYYDLDYINGDNYYLVLKKVSNPYLDYDIYYNIGGNMFIPASDIKQSKLYGTALEEHSENLSLESEELLVDYVKNILKTSNKNKENDIVYITDSNIYDIVLKSDYIFEVKIMDEVFAGIASDRNTFDCTVVDALKGDVPAGETVRILFREDTVKKGDIMIVALFEYEKHNPRNFVWSSKYSLFESDRKNEIISILNAQK